MRRSARKVRAALGARGRSSLAGIRQLEDALSQRCHRGAEVRVSLGRRNRSGGRRCHWRSGHEPSDRRGSRLDPSSELNLGHRGGCARGQGSEHFVFVRHFVASKGISHRSPMARVPQYTKNHPFCHEWLMVALSSAVASQKSVVSHADPHARTQALHHPSPSQRVDRPSRTQGELLR